MNIGFYLDCSIHRRTGNVIGDALVAETLCKNLRKLSEVESAEVYAHDSPFRTHLDAIYMNGSQPILSQAGKHILYWQNGFAEEDIETFFRKYWSYGYDGYAFFSRALLERHMASGRNGIYLPFCADTSFYYPRDPEDRLKFDVAYVGNDIKGVQTSMKYIYPAVDSGFALFGNWTIPKREKFRIEAAPYRKKFDEISRGRIPEEDVPIMYSSSKIILNTNIPQSRELGVISLRTFQVLACRGFLISDPVYGMEEELKGCVVFTEGYADLRDKIRYYLAHEDERRAIAQKGYEYVTGRSQSAASLAERLYTYLKEVC